MFILTINSHDPSVVAECLRELANDLDIAECLRCRNDDMYIGLTKPIQNTRICFLSTLLLKMRVVAFQLVGMGKNLGIGPKLLANTKIAHEELRLTTNSKL